jgi:hypothetical protein
MLPRSSVAMSLWLGLLAAVAALCAHAWFLRPASWGSVVADGRPVAGARVRFKAHADSVLTDSAGRFRLPSTAGFADRLTASKPGYVIAGAPLSGLPRTLSLEMLAQADCETYAFVEPAPDPRDARRCGNCHGEIFSEWSASGHASATRNRRFLNLYDGTDWQGRKNVSWNLLADHPSGAGVCNACHAPTTPFDADLRQQEVVQSPGIHCDFCHKIIDSSPAGDGLTHGRYGLEFRRPEHGQLFLGSLDDVDRGEDSFAPVYRESRYCAPCHEGVVFGVHAYSTYSEWLASPAGRQGKACQTCHMAPTGRLTNFAPGDGGIARNPWTLASHRFPGGQRDMLARCLHATLTIARRPAEVRVEIDLRAGEVGHRVPTGFVDRHLVLVVEAWDTHGNPVTPVEHATLPERAGYDLAGKPGRLYAKQLVDTAARTGEPAPFWRASSDFLDTRLFPERSEHASFAFPPIAERLRVRLLYRRFWQDVATAKGWPGNEIEIVDQQFWAKDPHPIHWEGP